MFSLYNILMSDRVVDIEGCFTAGYCRQITWAVIEESRTSFGTQLHPRVFEVGFAGTIDWPACLLQEINTSVIFGLPVLRQTFPLTWAEVKPAALPG